MQIIKISHKILDVLGATNSSKIPSQPSLRPSMFGLPTGARMHPFGSCFPGRWGAKSMVTEELKSGGICAVKKRGLDFPVVLGQ